MFKKIVFGFCCVFLIGIASCSESPIIEVQESDTSAQVSLEVVTEIFSTFDIIDDLASSNELLLKKGNEFLPHDVSIVFIDNTFLDGDGVELELDFGLPGNKPYGILCRDGKYRAGKIHLTLSKRYNEIGTDLGITFPKDNPYYSGDGEVLNQFIGTIHVMRKSDKQLELSCDNLNVISDGASSEINATIQVNKELDWSVGIINDIVNFEGEFQFKTDSNILTLSSIEPLQKKYTLDCAKYIVSGKLGVEQSQSASIMEIDFDPYQDNACDNIVSITVNDKTIIYKY